jgi:hypothetical protein
MTVPAVDAVVADVVAMAELNGLLDEFFGACHIGRPADDDEEPDRPAGQKKNADNAGSRERIGATAEYLRHRTLTVGWPVWRALALLQRKGTDQAGISPGKRSICTTL